MDESKDKQFLLQDEQGKILLNSESRLPQSSKQKWLFRFIFLVFLLGPLVWLSYALIESAALSKASSCYSMARQIHMKVEEWQKLDDDHLLETCIIPFSSVGQPDSLESYIQKMFSYQGIGWYAVVCNEAGELEYVLYSRNKITEDQLEPVTFEETRAAFANPFRWNHVTACYP